MEGFYTGVVKRRRRILFFFAVCFAVCLFIQNLVAVNYDMNDYLPQDTKSTLALEVMQEEFDGGIPNARVMVKEVSVPEALEYKEKIKSVEGVAEVAWLDDAVDLTVPIAMLETELLETYYKDRAALFEVTIDDDYRIRAVAAIREIIGDDNALTGSAVSTAIATTNTVSEIQKIAVIGVLFSLVVLLLTTTSWIEPFMVLAGLGVAIIINNGSNLIFGEISFVTNAAGSVLQLAVSMDYSVFLMHRFEECRKDTADADHAMVEALCKSTGSVFSSGLTTVIGFLALVLMQFRLGPDLGMALAKGIAISLITVFLFMPALILTADPWLDQTRHRSWMPGFQGLGRLVYRIAVPMACIFAVLIVPGYLASGSNEYLYGSSRIYGEGTAYGADQKAVEDIFGKSGAYVILVPKGDNESELLMSEELRAIPQITEIRSYADTVGMEIPPEYLDSETLSLLESENYRRFVISAGVDYEGEETFAFVENLRKIADRYYPKIAHIAGEGVSTYDLMDTVTADMVKVNLLAIGAVFLVLVLTMKSISIPVILVLGIETAIWLNLAVPYFAGESVYYIAYLIISSVQLGATVDYAILLTERYKENRSVFGKKQSVIQTISDVTVSILTSGSVLTVVGFLLGSVSTNQLLSQLGIFLGRGAVLSLAIVLFVLPGLLLLFDSIVIRKKKTNFVQEVIQQ